MILKILYNIWGVLLEKVGSVYGTFYNDWGSVNGEGVQIECYTGMQQGIQYKLCVTFIIIN